MASMALGGYMAGWSVAGIMGMSALSGAERALGGSGGSGVSLGNAIDKYQIQNENKIISDGRLELSDQVRQDMLDGTTGMTLDPDTGAVIWTGLSKEAEEIRARLEKQLEEAAAVNPRRGKESLNAMWDGISRGAQEQAAQKVYGDTSAAFSRNITDAFRQLEDTGDASYAMKLVTDLERSLPPAMAEQMTGPYMEKIAAVKARGMINAAPFDRGGMKAALEEADLAVKEGVLTREDADTAVSVARAAVRKDAAETAERGLAAYRKAFEETGSVAAARDAAYSTEARTDEARQALHDGITRAQSADLSARFANETAGATLEELRNIAARYGKKGEYAADYRGEGKKNGAELETLRKEQEAWIKDRIKREEAAIESETRKRAKSEKSEKAAAAKEDADAAVNTIERMVRQSETGTGGAGVGLDALRMLERNAGLFSPQKYKELQDRLLFRGQALPETRAVFAKTDDFAKDLGTPADRILEMKESLYEASLRQAPDKELALIVETFRENEAKGFLQRAWTATEKNGNISEKDFQEILRAGTAGKLDEYFKERGVPTAPGDPRRTRELVIGGDAMRRTMEAAGEKSREILNGFLKGSGASAGPAEMDRDADGDPNGFFTSRGSDGRTYRVTAPERKGIDALFGEAYVIEVLEGGKWKKAGTAPATDTRTQRERRGG
jgi:hypothetical protein